MLFIPPYTITLAISNLTLDVSLRKRDDCMIQMKITERVVDYMLELDDAYQD
jgi:hypothetical protein